MCVCEWAWDGEGEIECYNLLKQLEQKTVCVVSQRSTQRL